MNLRSGGPPFGLTPSPTVGTGGGINPTSLNRFMPWSNLAFDPVGFATGSLFQFDLGIMPDQTSPVLFLVSDLGPHYLIGETESLGGSRALGDIPTMIPEPSCGTLMMLCVALVGLAGRGDGLSFPRQAEPDQRGSAAR